MSLNAYITVKISFANSLALISERITDVDLDTLTDAIGADPRIGKRYLSGGLPFGGTCFPRDTYAFAALAKSVGLTAHLIDGANAINREAQALLEQTTRQMLVARKTKRLGIVGITFKANTPVLVQSPGLELARHLSDDFEISVYDPIGANGARSELGSRVQFVESFSTLVDNADAIVLTNYDEDIQREIEVSQPSQMTYMLDCWRRIKQSELGPNFTLFKLGYFDAKLLG